MESRLTNAMVSTRQRQQIIDRRVDIQRERDFDLLLEVRNEE